MTIGFTCGSFDLTHYGHYMMFKECKDKCDYLIVGLHTDPTIDRPKNKPVQSVIERQGQLDACKYIDKIIIYNTESELVNLLKEIKPDIRFIGSDWKDKHFTGDDLPIKIIFNSDRSSHGCSSSDLRKRVYESEKEKLDKVI